MRTTKRGAMLVLFGLAAGAASGAGGGPPATAPRTAPAGEAQALEAGKPAPAFSLAGSDGKTYTLAEFKGKKAVVLAWFPKAFTGG